MLKSSAHLRGTLRCATAALALALTLSSGVHAQTLGSTTSGNDNRQNSNNNNNNNQGNGTSDPSMSDSSSSDTGSNPFGSLQTFQPKSLGGTAADGIAQEEMLRLQQSLLFRAQGNGENAKPTPPGEFEVYVASVLGRPLPRYGANLLVTAARDFSRPATVTVPPDYIIQPGDKVVIALNGSVTGSVQREVGTDGKIYLESVGAIKVAGLRNADLHEAIARAVGKQYSGYTVSVNLRELHGIRVYVTGLAAHPGAINVNNVTSLANAVLQTGGPAAGGSFRSIKLYRNGQEVADFDLYKLMRGGSRLDDVVLQNEDVIFIPPAGPQVAVIGSVNEEAIYETRPGESVADMLAAAGGPNTLADPARIVVYHQNDPQGQGPTQLSRAEAAGVPVRQGDILQMVSVGSLAMPTDHQKVLVRVEGEVRNPGVYYVEPGTNSGALLAMAGGLTANAYPYGTKFTRQSVKIQQQDAFREAIHQMQVVVAGTPLTSDSSVAVDQKNSQLAAAKELISRLEESKPDGRLVLDVAPMATNLPEDIVLQNNDALIVPRRENTVGVFGAVPRPTSFLLAADHPMEARDYIERAGGALRISDLRNTIIVRANGEVLSRHHQALKTKILPGDVVFVPVRTQASTFWPKFKDIAQMLFGLGLSAATIAVLAK
ncbi:SLBB domain-containing protein [Novosphingobium sp.]|uniref:SLBB domain-containing protein n=1 Tax=Novosphingobium sp. TaxID=1874826 RepID=UPI0031D6117C